MIVLNGSMVRRDEWQETSCHQIHAKNDGSNREGDDERTQFDGVNKDLTHLSGTSDIIICSVTRCISQVTIDTMMMCRNTSDSIRDGSRRIDR